MREIAELASFGIGVDLVRARPRIVVPLLLADLCHHNPGVGVPPIPPQTHSQPRPTQRLEREGLTIRAVARAPQQIRRGRSSGE